MNSSQQFEEIVGQHYESLFRFALSLTRAEHDARDATQQTFYVWATKGHQLRDISKVKTWLFTTLRRAFLVARRTEGRYTHHELENVEEELPVIAPCRIDEVDAPQLLAALTQVDDVYQGAVILFYFENRSYREIASRLHVPVGTVKSRVARGVGQLRKILLSKNTNVPRQPPHRCEDW